MDTKVEDTIYYASSETPQQASTGSLFDLCIEASRHTVSSASTNVRCSHYYDQLQGRNNTVAAHGRYGRMVSDQDELLSWAR